MSDELVPVLPFRPAKRGTVSQDSTRETTKKELAPLFVPVFDKEPCTTPGCKNETGYTRQTPVDMRNCYIDGAGQLCPECYARIYPEPRYGNWA